MRTPRSDVIGQRFADRVRADTAGARGTLLRGRALLLDAAEPARVAVTGLGVTDGEAYGGERIGTVTVVPGTTTCVPLDVSGLGCSPTPRREGGPGRARALPTGPCNASSLPQPDAGGVVPAPNAAVVRPPPDAAPADAAPDARTGAPPRTDDGPPADASRADLPGPARKP